MRGPEYDRPRRGCQEGRAGEIACRGCPAGPGRERGAGAAPCAGLGAGTRTELLVWAGGRPILGGHRGRPAPPRRRHRAEHGSEFGHHHVQDDYVRTGTGGFGDQAAGQVLRTLEAGDVDGPPPADAVQQDLDFVAGLTGSASSPFQPPGLLPTG
ncbi:hypothetical protein ABCR94_02285 [Streptomyces sp. 21So2-11]|uniref:hypothetical protein n=1 Tax=Streptomyces sp. 21So2-11 TaxID=3144408 RepID=UPI00321B9715